MLLGKAGETGRWSMGRQGSLAGGSQLSSSSKGQNRRGPARQHQWGSWKTGGESGKRQHLDIPDKETTRPGSTDSPEALGFETCSGFQRTRVKISEVTCQKNSDVTARKPESGVPLSL